MPSGFTIISGSNFYSLGSISAGNLKNVSLTICSPSAEGNIDSTSLFMIANPTRYESLFSAAKNGSKIAVNATIFDAVSGIKNATFDATGCSALCHAGENADVKAFGNKYTPNTGEMADLWHMKMVRTNPTGYMDDQYVDCMDYSKDMPDAGRRSDPGGSPYSDNINAAKTAPNYTSADQPAPPYWIFDEQKQLFNDTYKTNDEIAGIIVMPPTGDRADIMGKAVYKDGIWTLEYGRKMNTGSKYDVQFTDMNKEYSFGTAIFDNAQTRHIYETDVSKLVFAAQATPTPTSTPAPISTPTPVATKNTPAFEALLAISALFAAVLVKRR
ncbi:MAG: hypothetical protein J5U17_04455 [Candidatus Methanoperedens sp.]|nr:hypothetical protein [Candidatus Methanoperedens sp.]MCE8427243.1 hypothetical protein [Candidatus Methanoperedens sp.]